MGSDGSDTRRIRGIRATRTTIRMLGIGSWRHRCMNGKVASTLLLLLPLLLLLLNGRIIID
jgi:hypothetical protein